MTWIGQVRHFILAERHSGAALSYWRHLCDWVSAQTRKTMGPYQMSSCNALACRPDSDFSRERTNTSRTGLICAFSQNEYMRRTNTDTCVQRKRNLAYREHENLRIRNTKTCAERMRTHAYEEYEYVCRTKTPSIGLTCALGQSKRFQAWNIYECRKHISNRLQMCACFSAQIIETVRKYQKSRSAVLACLLKSDFSPSFSLITSQPALISHLHSYSSLLSLLWFLTFILTDHFWA